MIPPPHFQAYLGENVLYALPKQYHAEAVKQEFCSNFSVFLISNNTKLLS
jgi:hypothetical protein